MPCRAIQALLLVVLLALSATEVGGANLRELDRSIAKQPAYASKPKYCLVVFGATADAKVWLVFDGDILYVDRNADGDLTKPDKRVVMEKGAGSEQVFKVGDVWASIEGGKIARLTVERYGELTLLTVDLDAQTSLIAGTDPTGNLRFSDSPKDAPIVHFGGPMTLQTNGDSLDRGRATNLYAMVGTPGVGPGTFAALLHAHVDPDAHVIANVEVIRKGVKKEPDKQRIVLDRRCCGSLFHGPVQVPSDAGDVAKVALSFENWKAGQVAFARAEVKIKTPEENSATDNAILNGTIK